MGCGRTPRISRLLLTAVGAAVTDASPNGRFVFGASGDGLARADHSLQSFYFSLGSILFSLGSYFFFGFYFWRAGRRVVDPDDGCRCSSRLSVFSFRALDEELARLDDSLVSLLRQCDIEHDLGLTDDDLGLTDDDDGGGGGGGGGDGDDDNR